MTLHPVLINVESRHKRLAQCWCCFCLVWVWNILSINISENADEILNFLLQGCKFLTQLK